MFGYTKAFLRNYGRFLIIYPFTADIYNLYHTRAGKECFFHRLPKFSLNPDNELLKKRQNIVDTLKSMLIGEAVDKKYFKSILSDTAYYVDPQVKVKGKKELLTYFDHDSFEFAPRKELGECKVFHSDKQICLLYQQEPMKPDSSNDKTVFQNELIVNLNNEERIESVLNNWFCIPVITPESNKLIGHYVSLRRRLNALVYLDFANLSKYLNNDKTEEDIEQNSLQEALKSPKPKRAIKND